MAETTLSRNPQKITVPADTADHTIVFDSLLAPGDTYGSLLIDILTGTVRFNVLGAANDATCGAYAAGGRIVLEAKKGQNLHYSGEAGSETFNIAVVSQ
jgi:hypothetical protein